MRNHLYLLFLVLSTAAPLTAAAPPDPKEAALREEITRMNSDSPVLLPANTAGNYREAKQECEKALFSHLAPGSQDYNAVHYYRNFLWAMRFLNEWDEYDDFFTRLTARFPDHVLLLAALTPCQMSYGTLDGGKFVRGDRRGNFMRYANVRERDRAQILALMLSPKALAAVEKAPDRRKIWFYSNMVQILLDGRMHENGWKLQQLTPLDPLPEPVEESNAIRTIASGSPVNSDGTPVLYARPGDFAAAQSDGERLRLAAERAAELDPKSNGAVLYAEFLMSQFDVLQGQMFRPPMVDGLRDQLYLLKDNETFAPLADGMRKIELPPEADYFARFRKAEQHARLGMLYEVRGQNEKAVREYQAAGLTVDVERLTEKLGWIVPLYRTGASCVTAPDRRAVIPYEFRNAAKVRISVRQVDADEIFRRLVENRSTPRKNWQDTDLNLNGFFYPDSPWNELIGKEVAAYTRDLTPLPHHWITRTDLKLDPLGQGLYLVQIAPEGAEEKKSSKMLVQIVSSAFLLRPSPDQTKRADVLLVNPDTGAPLPDREVEIRRYDTFYANNPKEVKEYNGRLKIETSAMATKTNAEGRVILPNSFTAQKDRASTVYLFAAKNAQGKRETLFETGLTLTARQSGNEKPFPRNLILTDRGVYRPGDTVKFTCYKRMSGYGGDCRPPKLSDYPDSFEVYAPRGIRYQVKLTKHADTLTATGELVLPKDAPLGQYSMPFRVEEYKKPEYRLEVKTPDHPAKPGETVTITVTGSYYFGAPLAGEKIHYKIYRTEEAPWQFYPGFGCYDWLYGREYGFYSSKLAQSMRDGPVHIGEEVIRDAEGVTDAAGNLTIRLDTTADRLRLGDRTSRYRIEAEVTDSTNRIVRGSGSVIAATAPFRVYLHPERGLLNTGDSCRVTVRAVSPDGKPVTGRGVVKAFRRVLDTDGNIVDDGKAQLTLPFGPDGITSAFTTEQPGVWRLAAEFTADDGSRADGETTVYVTGTAQNTNSVFSDSPLELVSDRIEYRPGDTAKLLIAANRPGEYVYVYRGGGDGVKMETLRLDGYSRVLDIPLTQADRPNMVVTAYTFSGGKVHTATKNLPVPPETNLLNVRLELPQETAKPGTKVPLSISISDSAGKPADGTFTLAVYDQALDDIAAAAIPPLNQFFWRFRRTLYTQIHSGLPSYSCYVNFAYKHNNFSRFPETDTYAVSQKMIKNGAGLRSEKATFMKLDNADRGANTAAAPPAPPLSSVRSNFLDSAYWIGSRTFAGGKAQVEIPLPDNLTTWRVKVWTLTPDTKVGEGSASIVVGKDLLARLELPRFLIRGDVIYAVANVHNKTAREQTVDLRLSAARPFVKIDPAAASIRVPANGHADTLFRITALEPGDAELTLEANGETGSDALKLALPVLEKGVDQQINAAGRLNGGDRAEIALTVPEKRRPETTFLTVELTPGPGKAVVSLLPYLAGNDAKDVFATVNRFVPAMSARSALGKLGVNFADLAVKQTARDPLYREYMERFVYGGKAAPSFDPETFQRTVTDNLEMLRNMQNSDGGWGWFSGRYEYSQPDTTAYVVEALLELAESNVLKSNAPEIRRGVDWLYRHAKERLRHLDEKRTTISATDALVAYALAKAKNRVPSLEIKLYEHRTKLSPYGLAMLGLTMPQKSPERAEVRRNLEQYLKIDREAGTAYCDVPSRFCWYWYGNDNETNAALLRLRLEDNPKDPVLPLLAHYLTVNVTNSPWRNSTRSLGAVVRALADYLRITGATTPDLTVKASLDGRSLGEFRITSENVWNGEFVLAAGPDKLASGTHNLEISATGKGAILYQARLNYYSQEDDIRPEGREMKLSRTYFRLIPDNKVIEIAGQQGRPLDAKIDRFLLEKLSSPAAIRAGDLIEVELRAESANDYDYVEITDRMPAGFEFRDPRSGYVRLWGTPVYCEFRETGAHFYLRNLARGATNITYRVRAQLPGTVTAPPATGHGVYAPALRCNGATQKFQVRRIPGE